MVRIPKNKVDQKIEEAVWQKLLGEIKKINSIKDLDIFLNKILAKQEKELLLRRLAILEFINQGKTYRKIKEILETSGTTISGAKDVLLGIGYNRRDKKKKYSFSKYNIRTNRRTNYLIGTSKFVFKK